MTVQLDTSRARGGIPRSAEVLVAALCLTVASPLLFVIALAIVVTSPGPVIFRQERLGRYGKVFILYKFRTMHIELPGPQVTARDDCRVTMVGSLLRMTKLDELLELWNVLKGDMSLVGPRPEVPRYVDLANPDWMQVLRARPGLTDPVTLKLRNEETLLCTVQGNREEYYINSLQPYKIKGYLEYLECRDWLTDIRVFWQTLLAVLSPGRAPAPTLDEVAAARRPIASKEQVRLSSPER